MAVRDGQERVSKLLAQRGLCSRRAAEALMRDGQVLVDGQVLRDPGQRVPIEADIRLATSGQRRLDNMVTLLMHKPIGIVSTQPEGAQIPAWQLITRDRCLDENDPGVEQALAYPHRCAVCGRLDQESRGLLVLSQDGVLAKRITGSHSWAKHYQVTLDHHCDAASLQALQKMRTIEGDPILPMQVSRLGERRLNFVLHQGRKHQIRRACAVVGLNVLDLLRERVGPWNLDGLPEGHWRIVPNEEVRAALDS